MRIRFGLTTLALLFLAACAPKPASTGSAADETAITSMSATYADGWNKGDVKALSAMLSEDIHTTEITGDQISGKAAWEKATSDNFAARPAGQTLTITNSYLRWLDGNTVAVSGGWSVAGAPAGAPAKGSWSNIVARTATGWQILASHVSVDFVLPAPMAADTSKVGK